MMMMRLVMNTPAANWMLKNCCEEIVETTLRNYLKLGKDSLTGPAVRKDMEVIDAEASTLSEKWSLVTDCWRNHNGGRH